jgi:hypothetical protein
MRLNEISDEQKSFLTLQGIKFDFLTEYQNIVSAVPLIGKSSHRSTLLGLILTILCPIYYFF